MFHEDTCGICRLAPCVCRTRPLEKSPSYLINHGNEHLVCAGKPPVVIADMKAKCAIGEMIAVAFQTSYRQSPPCTPRENEAASLIRAHLEWGLGCASFDAWLDVRHGTVVFVPAETIVVSARMVLQAPVGIEKPVCPRPVTVAAGFAYGSGAIRDAARLTCPVFIANSIDDPDGVQRVRVPPFASDFTLLPTGTGTLFARAITDGNGPYTEYTVTGPLTGPVVFPLANGVRSLEIVRQGVDAVSGSVVFRLDL